MISYVNGEFLEDGAAKVSVFDRGLIYGDAVYDNTRTFNGVPFRLDARLERLRKSLRFIEIPPDEIIDELHRVIPELMSRNSDEVEALGDVLVRFIVTRGPATSSVMAPGDPVTPSVIAFLLPINFAAFAYAYEIGVDLSVSLTIGHFAGVNDRRMKSTNRLGAIRGELKGLRRAQAGGNNPMDTRSWTIIFTNDGFVAEAHGANLFVVEEGRLVRPPVYECLNGLTLDTCCSLARQMGLEVEERRLTLYDLINADETFICTSSFQLLPVASVDGIPLDHQKHDVYHRLLSLYFDLVGMDFVAQAKLKADEQLGVAAG